MRLNLLGKLAIAGAAFATITLSSTAAFASVTPQNQVSGGNIQSWNQPPKQNGDPCTTSWGNPGRGDKGNTLDSFLGGRGNQNGWLDSTCKPAPPKSDPCTIRGDRSPQVSNWTWTDGRYVQCCKPTPPPVLRWICKPKNITFQLPTYGTWLLDVGGPALHNGEVIKYDGADWTVRDWTTGANGSQGHGTYFVLKDDGTTLKGLGISKTNPGPMLYEHAKTICPPVLLPLHPAF